jgi:hypothetical protein
VGRELTMPLTLQVRALSGQFASRNDPPNVGAAATVCARHDVQFIACPGRSLNRLPGDSSIPKIITNYGRGIAAARPLQRAAVETRFRLLGPCQMQIKSVKAGALLRSLRSW